MNTNPKTQGQKNSQGGKLIELAGAAPPASLEAEQSVLGSILLRPPMMDEILGVVSPEDFYREAHRKIYQALLDINTLGKPADLVLLNDLLKERGQLEEVGGPLFLTGLSESVGVAANAAYYARIVKDKARLRRLLQFCQETAAGCMAPVENIGEFMDWVESGVFEITQTSEVGQAVNVAEVVSVEAETLAAIHASPGTVGGLKTGYKDMDASVSINPKDLTILAARPSMGKTTLALNIGCSMARSNTPVAFFSLEMSKEQIGRRIIAAYGSIDGERLNKVRMTPEEWAKIYEVVELTQEWPLEIDDSPGLSVLDIRARSRRIKSAKGLGLIIIDYLQLMKPARTRRNREEEVSDTSRGLKALAKELEVPVIALSQLNRKLEERPMNQKRPRLSDLRESGAIEQDADVILFIYRDEVYRKDSQDKGVAEIIIGKQRNGRTGVVKMAFLDDYQRFEDLAEDKIEW